MKKPWYRKRIERVLVLGDPQDAAAGPELATPEYELVCTPQGRIAHLQHPEHGVLCGWPAPEWRPASASLPLCRLCGLAAEVADDRKAS